MRGRSRSSAKRVWPVTLATASTFRSALPMTRRPSAPTIEALLGGRRVLASHPGGGQLHRLVDLEISCTPAEVAGQRVLDLLPSGLGTLGEQGKGGEDRKSTRLNSSHQLISYAV